MQALEYSCQEVLAKILALRDHGSEQPRSCDELRDDLIHALERMRSQAAQLRCPADQIEAAHYALVALADETVTREVPAVADQWRNALQQHYFGENIAGDGFFDRLSHILHNPALREVGRIYALCLAFGFRGKYAVHGQAELEQQRNLLRQRIGLAGPLPPLAPDAPRPREAKRAQDRNLPIVWVAAFLAVFSVALITLFRSQLDRKSASLNRNIDALTSQRPPSM